MGIYHFEDWVCLKSVGKCEVVVVVVLMLSVDDAE